MKDFYILRIQEKKKGNMDIYNQLLIDTFGKLLSWEEVKQLDRNQQMSLMIEFDRRIRISTSKYDIKKLAYAIQNSRSGIGFSAMTNFTCAFCGKEEVWGNSAVPKICKECAKKMATNIILSNANFEK